MDLLKINQHKLAIAFLNDSHMFAIISYILFTIFLKQWYIFTNKDPIKLQIGVKIAVIQLQIYLLKTKQ